MRKKKEIKKQARSNKQTRQSNTLGRALCLEYGVLWVRVPPEAAHFFLGKSDYLGCAVLLCLVCLFDLACFFLSSFSSLIKNMYSTNALGITKMRNIAPRAEPVYPSTWKQANKMTVRITGIRALSMSQTKVASQ